jgi:hypothetical protein
MEKINIFFRHPFPEKKGMSTFPGENVIFHVRNAPQPFRLWITIQKFLKIPQIRGFLNGYPQKKTVCAELPLPVPAGFAKNPDHAYNKGITERMEQECRRTKMS